MRHWEEGHKRSELHNPQDENQHIAAGRRKHTEETDYRRPLGSVPDSQEPTEHREIESNRSRAESGLPSAVEGRGRINTIDQMLLDFEETRAGRSPAHNETGEQSKEGSLKGAVVSQPTPQVPVAQQSPRRPNELRLNLNMLEERQISRPLELVEEDDRTKRSGGL